LLPMRHTMVQTYKPTSECADCRLCSHGENAETNEIDRVVQEVVRSIREKESPDLTVPIGVSARHCHLNQEGMDILFGSGSQLTPYRELYQPGAFAAEESISVVGPRMRAIERIRVLGPTRDYNQVELARTDAIFLGLNPPVRDSGNLEGAEQITFIGPKGSLTAPAAIRAARHVHLRPADVQEMGLAGRESVRVEIEGEKGLIFENVRLKIDDSYVPELHLDTDDSNAADIVCGTVANLIR